MMISSGNSIGAPRFGVTIPQEDWHRRLGIKLKRDVLKFNQQMLPDQQMAIILQLKAPLTPAAEQQLTATGLDIKARISDKMVTARIQLSQLEALAKQDPVHYIEGGPFSPASSSSPVSSSPASIASPSPSSIAISTLKPSSSEGASA